ncbi:MAG TPA: chromate efflux transporter, partial [Gemmatimonadales bacterium]|nr:chromate efflux transporter [Gemmatimonadales bacterium]
AISAFVTAWTESEIVWVFVGCGVAALLMRLQPRQAPVALALAPLPIPALLSLGMHSTLFFYFAAAGLFVFGSGLAIVPFLHGGVVLQYHWLTERQFLDAVAVSIITPGPVVITVAFIGYLVAGPLGAIAAALGVFLPVYLITVVGAAYFRRIAGNTRVKAFVDGVTAAATGAIAGAVIVLGRRALLDVPSVLIALITLGLLSMKRRIPEPVLILAAGLAGIALKGASPSAVIQASAAECRLAGPTVTARWSGAIPSAAVAEAPLRVEKDIPLPGTASRFDYQSLEQAAGRLFISHMGAGQLVVFDVQSEKVLATLDGFPTVTGVLAVPAEHRAYASAAGDHAVVVVDDSALRIVARLAGPRFPDGLAYAPSQRRVFVSDESGQRDFVIDARNNSIIARIALGGEAGNTQYDAASQCIIVAVQTANQMAIIDPATATIVRRVTLDPAVGSPHGFYIDAPHRLAFITGEQSATLGVLDLETLQLRQVLPVGRSPDVLAFDTTLNRLYVAAESGVVSVFEEKQRSLTPLGSYRAPRAHSVVVDARTHRVYLPLASVDGRPVLRILSPTDVH